MALKTHAECVDGDDQSKTRGPIDGWEKQPTVVVRVVPVIHWGVHFSDDHAVIGCVVKFDPSAFNAGHEPIATGTMPVTGCRSNHSFGEEGDAVADSGCDEHVVLPDAKPRFPKRVIVSRMVVRMRLSHRFQMTKHPDLDRILSHSSLTEDEHRNKAKP